MSRQLPLLLGISLVSSALPCLAAAQWAYIPPSQLRKRPVEQYKPIPQPKPQPAPQAVQQPVEPVYEPAQPSDVQPVAEYPQAQPVADIPQQQPAYVDAQAPYEPAARPQYQFPQEPKGPYYDKLGLRAEVKTGYRGDNLKWNIASDITGTTTPNILSELTWDQVGSYEVTPKISYTGQGGLLKGVHVEGDWSRSYTFRGDNQDSDWAGNNRTGEFSRSNNDSSDGRGSGYSVGVGYAFDFRSLRGEKVGELLALIGYAQQQRDFIMTDGFQTIPASGPFAGLHSTYKAEWEAPYIGLGGEWGVKQHRFNLLGKFYRGWYRGEADWNLRADFQHPKSYEHKAQGTGFSFAAEYGWMFYPNIELTLLGEYTRFETDPGIDVTYFSDGTVTVIQLNDADWETQRYMAGLAYLF